MDYVLAVICFMMAILAFCYDQLIIKMERNLQLMTENDKTIKTLGIISSKSTQYEINALLRNCNYAHALAGLIVFVAPFLGLLYLVKALSLH